MEDAIVLHYGKRSSILFYSSTPSGLLKSLWILWTIECLLPPQALLTSNGKYLTFCFNRDVFLKKKKKYLIHWLQHSYRVCLLSRPCILSYCKSSSMAEGCDITFKLKKMLIPLFPFNLTKWIQPCMWNSYNCQTAVVLKVGALYKYIYMFVPMCV